MYLIANLMRVITIHRKQKTKMDLLQSNKQFSADVKQYMIYMSIHMRKDKQKREKTNKKQQNKTKTIMKLSMKTKENEEPSGILGVLYMNELKYTIL